MDNNISLKVCFEHLKTEDIEEYIQLARKELEVRKKEVFIKASNKLIASVKEFMESCPTVRVFINDGDSTVFLSGEIAENIQYEIDPDDSKLEIIVPWE